MATHSAALEMSINKETAELPGYRIGKHSIKKQINSIRDKRIWQLHQMSQQLVILSAKLLKTKVQHR